MSSKPLKWSFDIKGKQHERSKRELSVAGFIFTYVQNYFPGPLRVGGGDRPHPPTDSPLLRVVSALRDV